MNHYGIEDAPAGPLFTQRAPSNGTITSAAAADSLSPATLNAMQRRVLELLAAWPQGLTDEEIARALGMNPSTARPRRIELVRRGLIEQAGTRRTTSGRMASVWQATAASR
jgi:FixJ family two-component response regulator